MFQGFSNLNIFFLLWCSFYSIVDDLGFYLSATSKNPLKVKENFLDMAGQLKKVSDELTEKQRKVLFFLTKFDCPPVCTVQYVY